MNESVLRLGTICARVAWGLTAVQMVAAWAAFAAAPSLALMLLGSSGITGIAAGTITCHGCALRIARLVRVTAGIAIVPDSGRLHSVHQRHFRRDG